MHLFSGPVDVEAHALRGQTATADKSSGRTSVSDLEQRVSDLEAEVAALKEQLKDT
jgi:uncharacterized protein YceH (UPF0502 family)